MCTSMGAANATGGSSLTSEQKELYNQYMEKITTPSRIKLERTRSLFKNDGVFRDDDNLKAQIGEKLATEETDANAIQASVDSMRFVSVPDSKGFADVEIEFKPVTSYQNVGKRDLGTGMAQLKKKTKALPRQTVRIKIMNT